MTVFRIHIRPYGGAGDPRKSFEYCRNHRILGMGWAVEETGKSCLSWDEYIAAAESKYGYRAVSNVRRLKKEVKNNDLIWTHDRDGRYYLGRVVSPWEYLANEESLQADIVNFCRCEKLFPLDVDAVPGKVIACFRPGQTFQPIRDQTVAIYSQFLWNRLSKADHYALESQPTDIYAFLDDQATEDAVAIYLQMRGWLLLPESRKVDTMGYEYILINRKTLERAVVQIKSGNTSLDRDRWSGFGEEKVFLFQSYGKYTGSDHRQVECIDPDEIRSFIFSNRKLLPQSIKHWVDFVETQSIT